MYEANHLSLDLNLVSNIETIKPMYNHFASLHGAVVDGAAVGTHRLNGEHYDWNLEFNGYIPVVHEPSTIDLVNTVYYNPAPIFVPEVGSIVLVLMFAWLLSLRNRV